MEDSKKTLKDFSKILVIVLIVMTGIIASANAINFGATKEGWFPIVFGILNLGVTGYAAYSFYKKHIKSE